MSKSTNGKTSAPRPSLIVGLGSTGLSVADFLARQDEPLLVTDSRPEPPALATLQARHRAAEVSVGGFDKRLLSRCGRLVLSPGLPTSDPFVQEAYARGLEVIGDIELFARHAQAPVIAITGSNGKSTVTALVAAMAQRAGIHAAAGGNLGPPALDLLADPEPALYVLELSSFQLETTTSLRPLAAVVLNISPDHLDRYPDLGAYAAAKAKIYDAAAHCVINRDDPRAAALAVNTAHRSFGLDAPPQYQDHGLLSHAGEPWLARGNDPLLPVRELRIAGRHNQANALAALSLATAAGIETDSALQALAEFPGLPHRCQWVAEQGGVNWYNDSKATNVGAAAVALSGMDAPVILLAGGRGKGQDFSALRQPVSRHVKQLLVFGEAAEALAAALADCTALEQVADLDAACARAHSLAEPGDRVLLSPACASQDAFTDYIARGHAFTAAVRGIMT